MAQVRFFAAAAEALVSQGVQGVLVAPPELVPDVGGPEDLIVQPWVPQLALLEEVDAVVTHAGHNTTCEALAHGLPLVVAPIRDDQPVVADQVVAAGAAVRVRFGRVKPAELAAAVHQVLHEPTYRQGAERLQASFEAAGGPAAAAASLEQLVGVPA